MVLSVSKVGKFALKITAIPEQHMIEKFSTHALALSIDLPRAAFDYLQADGSSARRCRG